MPLPRQTVALLQTACHLAKELEVDAILFLTETDLNWSDVLKHLEGCRLLLAAQKGVLGKNVRERTDLTVIEIDPTPVPTEERMSIALLEAVRGEHLKHSSDVVTLYNGIDVGDEGPEHIDSLSIVHLGEHLERLTAKDLRKLETHVPLETLRAVVDLATQIGSEGREGKPVGTLFVVGDTRKVLTMARPINFNPFRGYPPGERNVRDPRVREQIKDIAQMEGAIIIRRDGVAAAACMNILAPPEGITLSKGLGTRHWAAAAISRKTAAIAVVVSQSSGTARIFQNGEVVLRIEPLARPMVWEHIRMDTQDGPSPKIAHSSQVAASPKGGPPSNAVSANDHATT